jgi:hypothetical protein
MAKANKAVTETPATDATVNEAPVFNLNASGLDFSDDSALQDELNKSGGKYFDDPGNVDLEIVAADFHKNKDTGSIYCAGDSTWFNVVMTFRGAGDKEIRHWVQVPTSKIKFGAKDTLAVFKKLQQFFFALGEEVTLNRLDTLVKKYFGDPGASLLGIKVNVDLGFEGPYVDKLPDSDSYGIYQGGKPITEDGKPLEMPDRASAVQVAKGRGIEPSFVKIVKFTSSKQAAKSPAKGKTVIKAAPVKAAAAVADEW